jgi:competence protein ComEA
MEAVMKQLIFALLFALSSGAAWGVVNLNTATKDELIALPGIGPAKAQAILDYRAAHGPFTVVEQLKDVKGIGAKRFEKLKPELTVGSPVAKGGAVPAKADTAARGVKGEIAPTALAKKEPAPARAKP